jgi:hypothetical protein
MLTTTQLIAARLRIKIDSYRVELEALKRLQTMIDADIGIPHLEQMLGEAEAKLKMLEMLDPKNN